MTQIIRSYGLTSIERTDSHTTIYHNGNMGNTVSTISENVDSMYFEGAYDSLRESRSAQVNGSPDYHFTLRLPNRVFDELTD